MNNLILRRIMPLLSTEQRATAVTIRANRSTLLPSLSRLPTGVRKHRYTATNYERRELRRWWADDSYGKRNHKDTIAWFQEKFQYILSTSIVSDYLSSKYTYLDDSELSKFVLSSVYSHLPEYHELEEALIEW